MLSWLLPFTVTIVNVYLSPNTGWWPPPTPNLNDWSVDEEMVDTAKSPQRRPDYTFYSFLLALKRNMWWISLWYGLPFNALLGFLSFFCPFPDMSCREGSRGMLLPIQTGQPFSWEVYSKRGKMDNVHVNIYNNKKPTSQNFFYTMVYNII